MIVILIKKVDNCKTLELNSISGLPIFNLLFHVQVVILIIIPKMKGSESLNTKNLLKFIVFFQYIPRVMRIYPLYKEVTRTSGIITETAWAGAAFNLILYMLASHVSLIISLHFISITYVWICLIGPLPIVFLEIMIEIVICDLSYSAGFSLLVLLFQVLGAFWYLFSIERETTCWKTACDNLNGCNRDTLYCGHDAGDGGTIKYLNESCPILTPNETIFNFGIFLEALQSGVVASNDFPEKFFYCFWWGLQNLR